MLQLYLIMSLDYLKGQMTLMTVIYISIYEGRISATIQWCVISVSATESILNNCVPRNFHITLWR